MSPRALLWLATALVLGCGAPAPRAKVVRGEHHLTAADAAMRSGGVVFAPFEELPVLGAELTQSHYRCIAAVNQAVVEALAQRYAIHDAGVGRRGAPPAWARGIAGPRVAVRVEAFRCGLAMGEGGYAAVASDDPGGPADIRGVAVLTLHDRSTGEPMMQIRAEAIGSDGVSAARSAASRAVRELHPAVD